MSKTDATLSSYGWKRKAILGLLLAGSGLFFLDSAHSHPISLTTTLADVSEEKVRVSIDVLVEDLILYYEIDHDEGFNFPREVLAEQAEEHRSFLLEYFQIRDEEGGRVVGDIVDIDFSEIGDRGVHMDDLMAKSIVYELQFPLDEPPAHLTVFQNFDGDNPRIPAEMELWLFQNGARIGRPVDLSHGTAHTVELNWDAEIEGDETDLEQIRDEVRERDAEELGIASFSTVYGYIYITETEVRHELLVPLLTLEQWIPIEREDEARITVEEQDAVRTELFAFLEEKNPVQINGRKVSPQLDRVEFFGPGIRDFAQKAPRRDLSVYNTRVGVILSFQADEAPEHVEFQWRHFDEQIPVFRPAAYTYDGNTHDVLFDPYLTTWEWEAEERHATPELVALPNPEPAPHLRLPMLSLAAGVVMLVFAGIAVAPGRRPRLLVCFALAAGFGIIGFAGRSVAVLTIEHPFDQATIDDRQARQTFETLHRNIYLAFEERDEERIYNALDQSVAGPLLEELYLQVRRGLTMEEQGGSVSRVEDVEVLEGELRPVEGSSPAYQAFAYQCTWTVTGTIEHWGHVHTRTNRYQAEFLVEGLPEGWRITGFDPTHEERLRVQTRLRDARN